MLVGIVTNIMQSFLVQRHLILCGLNQHFMFIISVHKSQGDSNLSHMQVKTNKIILDYVHLNHGNSGDIYILLISVIFLRINDKNQAIRHKTIIHCDV